VGAELRVWLLGGFRAAIDGRPVADEAWRRNKAKALVKLLALAPRQRLHREQLMDVLWPELAAEAAAANLRKAVYFARQALAPEHLRLRDDLLRLEAARLWIDVAAFETADEAGDLQAAVELYAGDLLPEDRFEPWTEERRERLHARFARRLLERARELEAAGEVHAAAAILERLAAVDPLNEEAVTGVMRAHALAGQRHLALRWYRQLEERLAEELGVEPGPEARRLHEELAAGRFPPAPPPPPVDSAGRPSAEGVEERKLVTVVLLDLLASADADPERARLELERGAGLAAEVLESWGGTVERLVGGSVLAVFGVPTAHEDDAGRALRAGLELLERSALPVRAGVATGEVIAPAGTGADPREIAGVVLEVAARLKESAPPGTVMAAERTCRVAGAGFELGAPLPVAKGTDLELRARPLVGVASGPPPGEPRLQGPLIGRDAELGVMLGLFEEVVASGRPRLLTVVGSAGVGKSRLVAEGVAAMAARRPDTTVLRGRCLSAGHGITYWALGEILREACGVSLSDPLEVAQDCCATGLRDILGRLASPGDLDATVFALAATCGVSLPGNPLDQLQPRAVADELAHAWPRFASACAAAGPALLVIEDLHWAGPELLETLELTVARATGPLLVVATTRPELAETRPGFGRQGDGADSISLRPLAEGPSRELLDHLAPAGGLAAGLGEEVLARAEGNPLFLEELVLHLAGAGAGALPDSLQALLAARMDGLPAGDKRVLQQAAVVGRVFWADPVDRAAGPERTAASLRSLERRGFVVRRPGSSLPGQTELSFRHALIHEVAYRSIPRVQRARAHAEVGDWLERLAGGRREEFTELLAYHFGAAAADDAAELAWPQPAERQQVRAKAFAHLLEAGAAARRRFAVAKAVELHRQAGTLAATDHEHRIILEELGDDHGSAYHGEEAMAAWVQALAGVRADPGAGADRARLCRKLAWLMASTPGAFRSNPDPTVVDQFVAEGLAAAEDPTSRAWLRLARGVSARLWRGSEPYGQGALPDPVPIEDRIADVEHALAAAEAGGVADLASAATSALKVLYGVAGRYQDVLALDRRELEGLAQTRAALLEQADVLRTVATNAIMIRAGFEEGLELARRCLELSAGSNPHQLMHALWPMLTALYHLGRWDELLPLADEHVAAFRQDSAAGCHFVRDGPVVGATVLAQRGELSAARALAAVVGDPGADLDTASAWQARFATASGDPDLARRISADKARERRLYGPQHVLALLEALVALEDWPAVAEFLPLARQRVPGNALLDPFCDRAEGLAEARAGRPDRAAGPLRRALAGFERLAVPLEAARTREQLAAGEPAAAARPLLESALATYQGLGCAPGERAVRASLLALA
jgi:DNA-binding SARP family transcriptional activator